MTSIEPDTVFTPEAVTPPVDSQEAAFLAPMTPALKDVPAHDLMAEESVLGGIVIHNNLLTDVCQGLRADELYSEKHRHMFRAMLALNEQGTAIDALTLQDWFSNAGLLEACGGKTDFCNYVERLVDFTSGVAARICAHVQLIKDAAFKRKVDRVTAYLNHQSRNGSSAQELISDTNRLLIPLLDQETGLDTYRGLNYERAMAKRAEYLKRPEIIEGLLYASTMAMITGAKHVGKSTLAHWTAYTVAKGLDWLGGRKTTQGQVLYFASQDEVQPALDGLSRLGWTPDDPLILYDEPIEDLTTFPAILKREIACFKATFVIIDLFGDFTPVKMEDYQSALIATRPFAAIAAKTGVHLLLVHHAQKYADPKNDVGTTALGSIGIVARASPVITVRKLGPGLYTTESTTVRDARGKPLNHSRLVMAETRTLSLGGPYRDAMRGECWFEKIIEALEQDPGATMTIAELTKHFNLDTDSAIRAGALDLLKQGRIQRTTGDPAKPIAGRGRPWRYFIEAPAK
jgi:hypothetical protein